ncbi:MAG: LysR substrate-binding domain-containing protein [Cyanobacteria bacterium]|nr:LysR substrate-binding domain-containing protein [Cyanobacteriota bacterium]
MFAIGLSDYGAFTLLPRLMQRLQVMAPQVRVQMRSGDLQKLLSLLDRGEIDLACGVFPERVSQHRQQVLFGESYVCVCRQNHPTMGNGLSLEDYLATSHLLVSIQEDRVGRMDIAVAT